MLVFQKVLITLSISVSMAIAATCGGGNIGDGYCSDSTLCCSKWGWCGNSPDHCHGETLPTKSPVPPTPTTVPAPTPIRADDSRLIAYLGNWQSCPTTAEVAKYTHIVIAFAVSYTWNPNKNVCSLTCDIAEPPICDNSPNPGLVSTWQAAGKKVILSFGGAGMGGSWAGDVNDCWEYCYGRETKVVNRLVQIVENLGLDGVDLDFEYHVTPKAVQFLNTVTTGLRNALPVGAEITHAPMDSDVIPGKPYFDSVLTVIGQQLDYLMPQYYNGYTRPAIDGISGTGAGSMSALSHYNYLVNGIYGGDPRRLVFGFCISDCSGTGSNTNAQQASNVMADLAITHPCNGGAFFWVAEHDIGGGWSSNVGSTINSLASTNCSSSPTRAPHPTSSPSKTPTASPVKSTISPSKSPVSQTSSPTKSPTKPNNGERCCPAGYTGLRAWNQCHQYYHCVGGVVTGGLLDVPVGTLFDQTIQNFNWASAVNCVVDLCGADPVASPTNAPVFFTSSPSKSPVSQTSSPTKTPTKPNNGERCCPAGYTGLRAWNQCHQYYHCVGGVVTGGLLDVPVGTLFDQTIQNFNWASAVNCVVDSCDRRKKLRG
jgi:hypothetical protein